jgi:hypothetical protein
MIMELEIEAGEKGPQAPRITPYLPPVTQRLRIGPIRDCGHRGWGVVFFQRWQKMAAVPQCTFIEEGMAYESSIQGRSHDIIGGTAGVAHLGVHADDPDGGRAPTKPHSLAGARTAASQRRGTDAEKHAGVRFEQSINLYLRVRFG